jgi:hypothetical protein
MLLDHDLPTTIFVGLVVFLASMYWGVFVNYSSRVWLPPTRVRRIVLYFGTCLMFGAVFWADLAAFQASKTVQLVIIFSCIGVGAAAVFWARSRKPRGSTSQ